MPGPRPAPSHLKIIRGVRGKKPSPREPKPVGDLTAAPEHFSPEMREVWDYVIANAPKGLLKNLDSVVLEIWCEAYTLHRAASAELRKNGIVIKAPNTGLAIQSPYLPIVNKQALIMLRVTDHLGFSPASRTRIELKADKTSAAGGWDEVEATG